MSHPDSASIDSMPRVHDKKVAARDKKDVIARRRAPTKQSPRRPAVERVPRLPRQPSAGSQ